MRDHNIVLNLLREIRIWQLICQEWERELESERDQNIVLNLLIERERMRDQNIVLKEHFCVNSYIWDKSKITNSCDLRTEWTIGIHQ